MKIAAIIISIVMVVSLIGFGVTMLAGGFTENISASEAIDSVKKSLDNMNINGVGVFVGGNGYGEDFYYSYNEEYSDIELGIISAKTTIVYSNDDTAYIDYKCGNSKMRLVIETQSEKIVIREEQNISFPFFGSSKSGTLNITLPKKVYDNIEFSTVSGSLNVSELEANTIEANTTSGKVNMNAFAEHIELSTISGTIEFNNHTNKRAVSVNSSSTSGTITLNGYRPESFELSAISGKLNMNGASGAGSVSLTSGTANLEYAEWNDDLDISLISGNVNVKLPPDSGVDLDFSKVSGEVVYNLAGQDGKFSKSDNYSFGGNNKQKVDVSLTSGKVNFSEYDITETAAGVEYTVVEDIKTDNITTIIENMVEVAP